MPLGAQKSVLGAGKAEVLRTAPRKRVSPPTRQSIHVRFAGRRRPTLRHRLEAPTLTADAIEIVYFANRPPLTAEEVLELPRCGGISGYELVDGRPVPVMWASGIQRRLIVTAAYLLEKHVRERGLSGEVRSDAVFVLALPHDPERVRAPDVSYMERSPRIERSPRDMNPDPERPNRLLRRAPDLAIEIDLEPAFSRPGFARKPGGPQRIVEYLEAGTRLVWVIDSHARTATVHRGDRSTQIVREDEPLHGEDVLPGLRLLLGDVFDL